MTLLSKTNESLKNVTEYSSTIWVLLTPPRPIVNYTGEKRNVVQRSHEVATQGNSTIFIFGPKGVSDYAIKHARWDHKMNRNGK
jgi:hypothetical protein